MRRKGKRIKQQGLSPGYPRSFCILILQKQNNKNKRVDEAQTTLASVSLTSCKSSLHMATLDLATKPLGSRPVQSPACSLLRMWDRSMNEKELRGYEKKNPKINSEVRYFPIAPNTPRVPLFISSSCLVPQEADQQGLYNISLVPSLPLGFSPWET